MRTLTKRFYTHPKAIVESARIGAGSRIWGFSHVMKNVTLGRDCNIGEHCYIENGVVIGDEVVIKNGVALWDGVEIEGRVFVGPNAVFTNDLVPRSKIVKAPVRTYVREGASIGANATILCGIEIGKFAVIGAGAVVTHDVPDFAIMLGNPARLRGYVCRCGEKLSLQNNRHASCECGTEYRHENGIVSLLSRRGNNFKKAGAH
jgi:UDP-2-acetamido-3-amino-2,3-dideoxy-glucuronate N-acetyltransferase